MKSINLPVYTEKVFGLPILQHYINSDMVDEALQYAEHLTKNRYFGAYQYPCKTVKCELVSLTI